MQFTIKIDKKIKREAPQHLSSTMAETFGEEENVYVCERESIRGIIDKLDVLFR